MSNFPSEVFKAFRSIGVEEDKAMDAALVFDKRDAEWKDVIFSLKSDMLVLKWSQGFTLAIVLILLGKAFIH